MATREDVILKNARSVEALLTNPAHKDAIEELALWALEMQRELGRVKARHAQELAGWDQRLNLVQMERHAEMGRRKAIVAQLEVVRREKGDLEMQLLKLRQADDDRSLYLQTLDSSPRNMDALGRRV